MFSRIKILIHKVIGFFRNLTFSHKFFLMSLLFSVFVLILFTQIILTQNQKIDSLKIDLVDVQFENPLLELIEDLAVHQRLSQKLIAGDKTVTEVLQKVQENVANTFTRIQKVEEKIDGNYSASLEESELSTSSSIKKWHALLEKLPNLTWKENLDVHLSIIQDLRSLSSRIENSYAYVLHNEPSSYYLKNNLFFLIPHYERLLVQLVAEGDYYISQFNKQVPVEENVVVEGESGEGEEVVEQKPPPKIENPISVTLIEKSRRLLSKIVENDQKAIKAMRLSDSIEKGQGVVLKPVQELKTSSNNFFSLLELSVESPSEVNYNLYAQESEAVLREAFQYADASSSRLYWYLEKRKDELTTEKWVGIAFFSLYTLLTFILAYFLLRAILRPLKNLLLAIEKFSMGDLTVRVESSSNEEIAHMASIFNSMADAIEKMLVNLHRTGVQLTSIATEITAAAKQQETSMVDQEFGTKEIAMTAKEIAKTAAEFSSTLHIVTKNAEKTSSLATSGQEGLNEMKQIMQQMVDSANEIKKSLEDQNQKTSTITGVITTITNVADRTNLLSLNAAIEAYKLGDKGGSFAVIAGEIRRLADQTAYATLDIEKVVNDMVKSFSTTVERMIHFADEIFSGVEKTNGINQLFSNIISQVNVQTDSFEQVNQGMDGQSQGAQQITESLDALSLTTQKSTAAIKQFHQSLSQLGSSIKELQNNIYNVQANPTGSVPGMKDETEEKVSDDAKNLDKN